MHQAETTTQPAEGTHAPSSVPMQVSNAMVRLFKEQFGRGPTKAKTHWAGPDGLMCILEETFTPAEKNLAAAGEHQRVMDVRLYFQRATRDLFIATVEEITGRRVASFMSAIDPHTDTAMECFVFEPEAAA